MANPNYTTDLLSSTFEIYMRNRPSDVVFGDLVLFKEFKERGRVTKRGGIKILEPITYKKSTAVGWYSGYDELDVTPQSALTNAEFEWKQAYGTVSISWTEEFQNSGEAAQIDILQNKIWQAETTLAEEINEAMFLDGAQDPKALIGLALAVDSAGTYGNINRSNYSWWSAQETAVGGALALAGSAGMRRMYNDCSLGRGRVTPKFIVTTQAIYEAYEALMDPYMRFTVSGPQNAGFQTQNLMFRNAKIVWDDFCQAGVMYFLNPDFLRIVEVGERSGDVEKAEDRDKGSFRTEPFVKPYNQDARVAKFFWAGAMVGSNCRHQGKLTGIS